MHISWKEIIYISRPKPIDSTFWKFSQFGVTPLENDIFEHLDKCENVYMKNGALGRPNFPEKRDSALHAFTMAIMTAARNFTYTSDGKFLCKRKSIIDRKICHNGKY